MGYLQDVDRWLDMLFADLADGKSTYAEVKREIRERILDSYRNGMKAGAEPRNPERRENRRSERRR